uniref:hypothetical protein n=1 Tax=Collinsella bouchesdurhonensis TaxID=1907654 RepID=UPI00359C5D55
TPPTPFNAFNKTQDVVFTNSAASITRPSLFDDRTEKGRDFFLKKKGLIVTKLFNPQVESLKNRNAPVVGENGDNLWGLDRTIIYI